jgi:hypothetical protein
MRKMSSDSLEGVECVPQMVIFDVVPRDFKQSAIQGNLADYINGVAIDRALQNDSSGLSEG